MNHRKKITFDLFHLTLVLALIRLGPEILIDDDYEGVALQMIQMQHGSTLGYRRLTHHVYPRFGMNLRLKTLDSVVDNFVSLRDRLDYFSRVSFPRDNVIAYNPSNATLPKSFYEDNEMSNNAHSNNDSETSAGEEINRDTSPASDDSTYDLSPEDMDLIEILWKQDIDLGVSLDAFSQHQYSDKPKEPPDILKPDIGRGSFNEKNELEGIVECGVKEKDEICYTVDYETGEHIFSDQKLDDDDSDYPAEHSLFSTPRFDDLPDVFLRSSEDPTLTANSLDQAVDLEQDFDTDSLPDIDLLFGNSQSLETILKELDEIEEDTATEMYPSMEEYWQDISTTLPLSVMGTSDGCSLYAARPSRTYSQEEVEDYCAGSPTEAAMRPVTNDTFAAAMLPSSNFNQNASDLANSYGYLPSLIGPTSLGCAVASSIATLTNDTDPLPDMVNAMNATFGLDLPGMALPNQTTNISANERLLSDLLMEEELQLMEVGNVHQVSAQCSPGSKIDHFELSSDSAASSNSGNASLSDYRDTKRTVHYEELTSADYAGNESLYQTFKYYTNYPPTISFRSSGMSSPQCDVGLSTSRNNYNQHVHHNHSYNLPPLCGNNSPRPITRDKMRQLQAEEEANNRDEKRAKALELPLSISDITNLAIDDFNEKLSKFELTEPQITLIRDIRRRGKNKVAAQNCRKRKMDQISSLQQDLDSLHTERLQVEAERSQLLHQKHLLRTKYSQLCQIVLQSTNSQVPSISDTFPLSVANSNQVSMSEAHSSDIESPPAEKELTFNQGVRAKVKTEKKRYDYR